jgi:hypothetical protein
VFKTNKDFASGEVTEITYAMAWNKQYQEFKEGVAQTMSGTPLSELPFLTASKRLELKALHIHTAETLAALDGPNLKRIGMDGRELKNQAQAYLDNAAGSVDVVKMAATIAALEAKLERLTSQPVAATVSEDVAPSVSPFAQMEAEDIKNWIKESGGTIPRGNASHATLVKAADEWNAEMAESHRRGPHNDCAHGLPASGGQAEPDTADVRVLDHGWLFARVGARRQRGRGSYFGRIRMAEAENARDHRGRRRERSVQPADRL